MTPALERAAPRSLAETIADLEMEIADITDEITAIQCFRDTNLTEGEWRKIERLSNRRGELRRQVEELRGESNVVVLFDDRPAS